MLQTINVLELQLTCSEFVFTCYLTTIQNLVAPSWGLLVAQSVWNPPAMQEMSVMQKTWV